MAIARQLAKFAHELDYQHLPPATIHAAKRCILDALGCVLGAYGCPAAGIIEETIDDIGGPAEATIFVSGKRSSVFNALLVNSALVRYLDLNDVYVVVRPQGINGSHPSDAIATILALGERERRSGKEVIAATVLAYQLFGLILDCEPIPMERKGWAVESKAPLFMPLVAGKLLGLTEDHLEQSVGISGSHGFTLGILDTDGEEYSMTKNIRFARTAYNSVLAALLARRGFTGPRRVVEGKSGFVQTVLGGDFDLDRVQQARDGYVVDEIYFKRFAADATNMGHLSATYEVITQHDVKPEDVRDVHLRVTNRCAGHCAGPEKMDPTTKEMADHSCYYTTAALISDRTLGPAQYTEQRRNDPKVRELMRKVRVEGDAKLDGFVSAGISAITTTSGATFAAWVDYPHGHPKNPMTDDQLIAKFVSLAEPVIGKRQTDLLTEIVFNLDQLDGIDALLRAMVVQ